MLNLVCDFGKFKKLLCIGFVFISISTNAQDFVAAKTKIENIKCSNTSAGIRFQGIKQVYRPYDKNIRIKKIENCGIIKIDKLNFINISLDAEIKEGPNEFRASILEIIAYDPQKKNMRTVRSEVIDQVPETGDPAEKGYEITTTIEWGYDKKNEIVKLKVQPNSKTEKIEAYFLKMNKSKTWLENDFSDLKK